MKKVIKILFKKWYVVLFVAACIIAQCNLQLMLPEKMGNIQTFMSQYASGTITKDAMNSGILETGGWMLLIAAGIALCAVVQNGCSPSQIFIFTPALCQFHSFLLAALHMRNPFCANHGIGTGTQIGPI